MTTDSLHSSGRKKYGLTAVALWTIFVGGMLAWNLHVERANILEQARVEARAIWSHNLSYRKWVTAMGGIYVRADRIKPNPYLKSKDRDKRTTDGIALTMANPAYMTGQVFEIIKKESEQPIINRIVSEKYFNPANKPDAWEEKSLHAFEAGTREVSELSLIDGRPYLRLFRPMITTEGCLNCHGEQGYQVGDIRGGISVAVPMAQYEQIEAAARMNMALIYLLLWGFGAGAIVFYHLRIDKNQLLILESEKDLAERVMLAELSADIGLALTRQDNLRSLLKACAEAMVRHLDVAFARIWTLNADENVLELQASAGMYTRIDGGHRRVPVGELKIGLIAAERQAHITNSVIGDPRVHDQEWAKREGMVAFAGHPLIIGDQLVGVMAIFSRHQLTDVTLKALAAVSHEIAIGIACKQAEERDRLHSAIVASSNDAIIAKDLAGIILAWNRGAEELYGYGAEEVLGRSIALLVPPDHSDELGEILDQLKRGERVEHYTTERVRKDGQRIAIALTISPLRDGAGKLVGASSIAHDVSKRLEAEESLRRREERLREAQRLARVGSWELDLLQNKITWSDEIYRIFEVDPALFGASYDAFLALLHPDDRAAVDSAYTHSLQDRTHYAIEHRLLFPDGRVKYVFEQCETFYAGDGTALRSIGTVQEITERKEAEEKIRELNAGLERRVTERTRELQSSQAALINIVDDLNEKSAELEQANARLQELDRLKSMFIASMSHELRTPLNSIIGFSSILHDEWVGPVNAEQKENLAIVHRCGQYLLSLINDVIDVSKIEAGKIESIPEEFDLRLLIDEAITLIKKDLEEKGLELQVIVSSQSLYSDRRRLLQCVLNLLTNAVKFTPAGTISVEVQLVPSPGKTSAGRAVEIAVADTGIGIRGEDQAKMFQPFVRLVSPLQANIPGTGLGLYLTRKLAQEVLHGEVLLSSVYGQGSRFTLRIPVRLP